MRVKPRTPNAQQALCLCAASQTTPTSLSSHTTRDRISKELMFPMKERKRMIWGSNIRKKHPLNSTWYEGGDASVHGLRGDSILWRQGDQNRQKKKKCSEKKSADEFKGQEEDKRERQGHRKIEREQGGGDICL